jgi:hypothetical protein
MTDQSRLSWALGLSLLAHLTVLALLPILRRLELPALPPPSIDVDLTQLPLPAPKPAPVPEAKPVPEAPPQPPPVLLPKRQIVTPPDAGEEKPPKETRLLSDRDNTVPEEMLRRGEPAPGEVEAQAKPAPVERAAPPPKAVARPKEQVASLPKLDQLLPHAGDIVRQGGPLLEEAAKPTPAVRNLFAGQGGVFASRPGSNDFLPAIREGDITLLNTKAERFAPFVRRVALRVFQHLERRLRTSAERAAGSGREFAVVEAVMNRKGRLVGARVVEKESNSSLAAYRELLGTTQPDIFFDSNPPAGAEASDGNIHFVLVVDLTVQSAVDPRTGRTASSFFGIAGVGLDNEPVKE